MSKLYLDFFKILSAKRKKQLALLIILMITNCFAEVISVASVIPFLIVISNPEKLQENYFMKILLEAFGISWDDGLIFPVTLLFVFTVIIAGLIRLANLWFSGRISVGIGADISCEIYRRVLLQEYKYHLQKNTSEIISALSSYISQTIAVIRTILNLLTSIIVSIGIILSLFFIDWKVAITSISIFAIFYIIIAFIVRPILHINSQAVADSCQKQVSLLQDSLGSIRDIILDSNQNIYIKIFRNIDTSFRIKAYKNEFIAAFPKYFFEIIGFCIIAFLAFFLVTKNDSGILVLPILGAFALGAQKLLPSLQQVYVGWSYINASISQLKIIIKLVNQPIALNNIPIKKFAKIKEIIFQDVSFKYSDKSKLLFDKVNFKINAGEMIGIIGTTGCGKSTVVDILMGLLTPINGKILINKKDLHEINQPNIINSWRAAISHVPQNIFISNTTIKENIAFGVPKKLINMRQVEIAAKQSQIYDFITKSKNGFDTKVGERGCNLSGGQLQRIGIARALYKNKPVLVLDEATSALDTETEQKIMQSISKFKEDKTIIIISHKNSSLTNCDKIFKLRNGLIEKATK
tara:strand:- start:1129 stop:2865 length:1737 start_codon:yes stop_codon:yes gene_type:complete